MIRTGLCIRKWAQQRGRALDFGRFGASYAYVLVLVLTVMYSGIQPCLWTVADLRVYDTRPEILTVAISSAFPHEEY